MSKKMQFIIEADTKTKDNEVESIYNIGSPSSPYWVYHLPDVIEEPTQFYEIVKFLSMRQQHETVEVTGLCSGGDVYSGLFLLEAFAATKAILVMKIFDVASMGALLTMGCAKVTLTPFASMMVHNLSIGSQGSIQNQQNLITHLDSFNKKMIDKYFKGFLDEAEMKQVLGGSDLYLNRDQLEDRFGRLGRLL